MQTPETIIDHRTRIKRVMVHINRHLENRCRLNHLADIACFSPFHFLRVFETLMGETPGQYVLRKRMEQAGFNLLKTDQRVTDIAFLVGYETTSSFSKVFKTQFKMSPRRFRDTMSKDRYLHPNRAFLPAEGRRARSETTASPVIKTLPAMKVAYIENRGIVKGSFFTTAMDSFKRLGELIRRHDLRGIVKAPLSIYPHRVFSLEDRQAMSYTGVAVSRKIEALEGLQYCELPPGRYAIFSHYGPYQFMMQTWNAAYMSWLPQSGRTLRDAPPVEIYLNRTSAANACQHNATILIPIY